MDNFIATILVLHDNINETASALKKSKKSLARNSVSEKQYLAYYVYRIWIKYRKLISNVNTPSEFNKVLAYLEIPSKYYDMDVVYPLVNKMTSNENQLDYVILNIMNQMNKVAKLYSNPNAKEPEQDAKAPEPDAKAAEPDAKDPEPDAKAPEPAAKSPVPSTKAQIPDTTPKSAEYDQLVSYLEGKNTENIIQDIIQLKLLVPNLARPAQKFDIWGTYMPYLRDLEALIRAEAEEQVLAEQELEDLPPELLAMLAADEQIPQQQSAGTGQTKP